MIGFQWDKFNHDHRESKVKVCDSSSKTIVDYLNENNIECPVSIRVQNWHEFMVNAFSSLIIKIINRHVTCRMLFITNFIKFNLGVGVNRYMLSSLRIGFMYLIVQRFHNIF